MKPTVKTISVIIALIGAITLSSCKSEARKLAELTCKLDNMMTEIRKDPQKFQSELSEMQKEIGSIKTKYADDKEFLKEYAEEIQNMDDCSQQVKDVIKATIK